MAELFGSGKFWLGVIVGAVALFSVGKWQQKKAGS